MYGNKQTDRELERETKRDERIGECVPDSSRSYVAEYRGRYKAYKVKYSERPACVGTLGTTYCSCLEQLTIDRTSTPK